MIGVFSDHCESPHGRRRPFFMAGALLLAVCLVLFSHAEGLGGDVHSALVLAFLCFWLLDFSTNFMEGPLRALCSDTLSEQEQLQSNSWFGIMNGLASTAGFALGYLTNDIRVIFGVAAAVVISTALLTSYLVDEAQHSDASRHAHAHAHTPDSNSSDEELGSGTSNRSNSTDKDKDKEDVNVAPMDAEAEQSGHACSEFGGALSEMVLGLRHMPSIVARCWTVQFCTYFSNFA